MNAPDLSQKKILVVDDDLSIRQMLVRILTDEGYQAVPAANGLEALAITADHQFDMVLLDLNMPGKSGWDTFERLTAENPCLSVIIITARPHQLFTALAAGVGALLEKPLDFPILLETVRTLLMEPPEMRLARLAGKAARFHFLPSKRKTASPEKGKPM